MDLNVGTLNVRSLYKAGALTTSLSCLEQCGMDIIAIQEMRLTSSGSLKSQRKTLLYNGGDRHICSVVFVVKDNILPIIMSFKPISDRICYMELKYRWYNVFLVNCYAPTEDKSDDIKKQIL